MFHEHPSLLIQLADSVNPMAAATTVMALSMQYYWAGCKWTVTLGTNLFQYWSRD